MAPRKNTADKVADLAHGGMYASQIARALGISPQRVSQIIKDRGITIKEGRNRDPDAPFPLTHQFARTGGVSTQMSTVVSGLISETLVEADLLARGWQVYTPRRRNLGTT